MSGAKNLVNQSKSPLRVTLLGRDGNNPSISLSHQVAVLLQPGQKLTDVRYGDDTNPFLNGITIQANDPSSTMEQTFLVLQRGDQGTLDGKLNTNGTFEFQYDPGTNAIAFTAHN